MGAPSYLVAPLSTVTNSTFAGNSAFNDGGAVSVSGGTAVLTNSIVWGNTNASWSGQLAAAIAGTFTVSFSLVQGGWTGVGSNNITDDPQFVRQPSPGGDGAWGTGDDDYGDLRLQLTSPAIDAGDNGAVPAGVSTDLAGQPRFADVPTRPDTGAGTPPIVDMGAYEQDSPPTLVSVVSRKIHGAAGTFDLSLSLTGTTRATGATIEPRKDGPTQLVFTFSEPIQAIDGTLDGIGVHDHQRHVRQRQPRRQHADAEPDRRGQHQVRDRAPPGAERCRRQRPEPATTT